MKAVKGSGSRNGGGQERWVDTDDKGVPKLWKRVKKRRAVDPEMVAIKSDGSYRDAGRGGTKAMEDELVVVLDDGS